MIELKTENGTTSISLRPDEGIFLQDEIVQIIVSSLMAFREQITKSGQNSMDADKDAGLIINNAVEAYNSLLQKQSATTSEQAPNVKSNNQMANIMKQIDDMIYGKSGNNLLS